MPALDNSGRTTSFFEFWPILLMYLPVAIQWLLLAARYRSLSLPSIADTIMTNFKASEFDHLIKPITPQKTMNHVWTSEMLAELLNVKILSKLTGCCDPGKTVLVLLRHSLSVNGKLAWFKIHPNFSDSLEGLIIVDARKTLRRFPGADGSEHLKSFNIY